MALAFCLGLFLVWAQNGGAQAQSWAQKADNGILGYQNSWVLQDKERKGTLVVGARVEFCVGIRFGLLAEGWLAVHVWNETCLWALAQVTCCRAEDWMAMPSSCSAGKPGRVQSPEWRDRTELLKRPVDFPEQPYLRVGTVPLSKGHTLGLSSKWEYNFKRL